MNKLTGNSESTEKEMKDPMKLGDEGMPIVGDLCRNFTNIFEVDGKTLMSENFKTDDIEWETNEDGEIKIFTAQNNPNIQFKRSCDHTVKEIVGGQYHGEQ